MRYLGVGWFASRPEKAGGTQTADRDHRGVVGSGLTSNINKPPPKFYSDAIFPTSIVY